MKFVYLVILFDPDQPAKRFEIDGAHETIEDCERAVDSFNAVAERHNLVLRARVRVEPLFTKRKETRP